MTNSYNEIRPFYIIPGVNVDIKYDPSYDGIACVERTVDKKNGGLTSYKITVNIDNIANRYERSWLFKQNIPFKVLYNGIIFHEIAHIKYEAFSVESRIKNEFFSGIYNTLLDSNNEYRLTSEFPGTSKYIRTAILMLKRTQTIDHDSKNARKAEELSRQLFFLVRFGVILPKADLEFINFAWPIVLSSLRGNTENVMSATEAIYIYIAGDADNTTLNKMQTSSHSEQTPMTDDDFIVLESGGKVLANSMIDTIEQIKTGSGEFAQSKGGEIRTADEDNAFYRQVLNDKQELISDIRTAFKIVISKYFTTPAYEGDINYSRMIQAYVNSLTGDEGLDYTYNKRIRHLLDVVVLRDISYSTKDMSTPYAILNVALLAALSNLKGIRIAEIDFSTTSQINLSFDEPLSGARLEPAYESGTEIIPAYEMIRTFTWKAHRRICIVITDGQIEDYDEYTAMEKELSALLHIEFVKFLIIAKRKETLDAREDKLLVINGVDEFPDTVAKYLIGRL